ncbi:heterocyst differentiation related protein [Nostoc spongiaeforme FACHB-130]|uniref:Heterocyst differentiation related protein n=1 Tax=Nostoc spongiaeforme FACHB-130 TaxID=1357510 RepID=A0ABR8FZ19_9NOSO|nr:cell division protein ZapB [Nostoc spongiaeforme]MBD2595587.1 heterocyst differentiation related protein [Nostoc spongiaeforme FACHB-130]
MSESMAFIGGVAVAGLAALVLLKGANNPLQPNFTVTPQMPTVVAPQLQPPVQYPSNYGQPYPNPQPPTASNPELRAEFEQLKAELNRLRTDNEQLKGANQRLLDNQNAQQLLLAQQNSQKAASEVLQPQNAWWTSPIVWAVGGATLTVGGGIVVAGVLALFGPRSRPTRTVQVIHPYQGSTPPLVPVRRAEFLPPSRQEARRVEAPEYDEMH